MPYISPYRQLEYCLLAAAAPKLPSWKRRSWHHLLWLFLLALLFSPLALSILLLLVGYVHNAAELPRLNLYRNHCLRSIANPSIASKPCFPPKPMSMPASSAEAAAQCLFVGEGEEMKYWVPLIHWGEGEDWGVTVTFGGRIGEVCLANYWRCALYR